MANDPFAKDMDKALPPGYKCGVAANLLTNSAGAEEKEKTPPKKSSEYLPMFQEWREKLLAKLKDSLPNISGTHQDLSDACQAVMDARKKFDAACKRRDEIKKHKPIDEDALEKAKKKISEAEEEEKNARQHAEEVGVQLLQQPEIQTLISGNDSDYDDTDLILYTVLTNATPKKLAQWCDEDPDQARQLLDFLNNIDMVRKFVNSGGARKGEYGRAVQIYHQIHPDSNSDVLQRLALAVALELSAPYGLFDRPKEFVDPLKRYVHYEQAYLLGELDPNFSTFNVWELRQVVNSDASEEELRWGRQSLMNYRPDIAYSNDAQWQYCMIVKSDVNYAAPDWYKRPRSYDQILSGGGKCGPRAWYGRFACKSFGIPTWGAKQPGHAAMTRWTRNGWCTCLGAAFKWNYWEDEGGEHFELTTKAMRACETEEDFTKKVRRLEWIAAFYGEKSNSVKRDFLPDPSTPWWCLSLFQRQYLARDAANRDLSIYPQVDISRNAISTMKEIPQDDLKEEIRKTEDGTIIIPAAACSKPIKNNKQVIFHKSFLGGQQLFIKENGSLEYTLKAPFLQETATKYKLTCRVCTAHRKEEPINLVVDGGDSISIPLPYNMAMWEETEPVDIELGGPDLKSATLNFQRKKQPFGFALKDIKLTPA